jgi:hypothetical protein
MCSYLESLYLESLEELKKMNNALSELQAKETPTTAEQTTVVNLTSNIPIYKEYITKLETTRTT